VLVESDAFSVLLHVLLNDFIAFVDICLENQLLNQVFRHLLVIVVLSQRREVCDVGVRESSQSKRENVLIKRSGMTCFTFVVDCFDLLPDPEVLLYLRLIKAFVR
jgi:hypothetical protein